MARYSAQGTVTVRRRPADGQQGDNGAPAVSYWIVTSQSSIKKGVDGTLTPATISAVRMKSVGGSAPQPTTDYAFIYCEYNTSGTLIRRSVVSNGQSITPTANAASLNFYMLPTSSSDLSTSIANASISVVNDGENGVGSYAMDLDNENINIGLVANNGSLYPATGYNVGESGIYVAAGGNNTATLTKMELLSSTGSVLATATSSSDGSWNSSELGVSSLELKLNKIKVTFATNKAHSSGERLELKLKGTIQVTDGNGTRTVEAYKVWDILFQPPGANGVSPTVYELQPSNACVVIDPNSGGIRTPSTVSCKVIKHYGNTYEDVTNTLTQEGLKLYAVIDGVENETSSQNVSLATNLEWRLKKGSTVIDKEVIAFINEGENGDNGAPAVSLMINPSSLTFNETNLVTKYVTVYINRGGVPENPKSVQLAESVENLNCTPESHTDGSKTLRLSPQSGFYYNGNISIVVVDNDNNTYLGSINVAMVKDGDDGIGINGIAPTVTPAYINYTAGSSKVIPMSLQIMDGGEVKTPSAITIKFNNSAVSSYGGFTWNTSSKTLTIASTATFGLNSSDTITFGLTYKSKTYTINVPVSRTLNGSRGPAGLIYRKTEWQPNTEYSNDEDLLGSQEYCYLDIVYRTGSDGKIIGVWECLQSHTSTSDDMPTGDGNDYWRKVNKFKPIYTPLIIAEGAVLGFMQGNQLKIYDLNGNLKAGISAATGDYPIFYANPQKYPVRVDVSYAVTTAAMQGYTAAWYSNSDISTSQKLTLPNNRYLHLQFHCYWSDGSSSVEYRMNLRNTTGSQLQASSPMPVAFRSTRTTESTEANAATSKSSPCTNVAKPYLWICVTLESKFYGWYKIAQQQGGTEDSTRAMFQVKESGDTIMGMPTGARLHLVAAPDEGLPRMDIYDEDGNPAATFDGTKITDSSVLYGTGSVNKTLAGNNIVTATISGAPSSNPYKETQQTYQVAFTTNKYASVTIPAFQVKLWGHGGTYGTTLAPIRLSVKVFLDGIPLLTLEQLIDTGQTVSQSSAYTANFNGGVYGVSPGSHNVRMVVIVQGFNGSYASAMFVDNVYITAAYGSMKCLYFANGIAIGSASDNYFMVWNDGTNMQFVVENRGMYGLKVTNNGVYIKRPTNPDTNNKWTLL